METLRYSSGKLFGTMICGLVFGGFCMAMFLYPDSVAHIPKLRVLATTFGHTFVAPALVLACAIVAWRGALILVGDRKAVEALSDGVVLTTWWKSRRVAWSDIGDVEIGAVRTGRHISYSLDVLCRARGLFGSTKVSVPLGTTELHRDRYQDFAETLSALAQRGGVAASGRAQPAAEFRQEAPPEPPAFDADAALARYMAKKASGMLEAPGPATPARPVFGRKAV